MIDWREQEVHNETRSREINEWIDESNEHSGLPADPFVCECSGSSCPSTIALTHLEYEEVRAYSTHFAIATDHESPDLDLLVSERAGFTIIRKLPGMPARVASGSDPRNTGRSRVDIEPGSGAEDGRETAGRQEGDDG